MRIFFFFCNHPSVNWFIIQLKVSLLEIQIWTPLILFYCNITKDRQNVVKSFYNGSCVCVKVKADMSEWFRIVAGVCQGCVMSPWQLNVFVGEAFRHMRVRQTGWSWALVNPWWTRLEATTIAVNVYTWCSSVGWSRRVWKKGCFEGKSIRRIVKSILCYQFIECLGRRLYFFSRIFLIEKWILDHNTTKSN